MAMENKKLLDRPMEIDGCGNVSLDAGEEIRPCRGDETANLYSVFSWFINIPLIVVLVILAAYLGSMRAFALYIVHDLSFSDSPVH